MVEAFNHSISVQPFILFIATGCNSGRTSNVDIQCVTKARATVSAGMPEMGIASGHLVY